MKCKIIIVSIIIILCLITYKLLLTHSDPKQFTQTILESADIHINGDRPWDIAVYNDNLYARALSQGSLGLGESYMDGWWDAQQLDQFFYKLLSSPVYEKIGFNWPTVKNYLHAKLINLQAKSRAFEVGEQHYDIGNTLFSAMLDPYMIYSCAYWKSANTLDKAQEHKLELICKKLHLKPGMKVLDIGCGWGGLARYMASKYGCHVTGITVSKEQAKHAQGCCASLPITIQVQDYRDLNDTFDRIVSVGMFEHVGYKNYKEYMRVAHKCLKDDGLFLLHTIGRNESTNSFDPWIAKYIFPNSMLPSIAQISLAAEGLFIIEDIHNFGSDYDKTLMAWFDRFDKQWDTLKNQYNDRFYRMWKYYLLSCAGLFRARQAQLWQLVFSKYGVPQGYESIR